MKPGVVRQELGIGRDRVARWAGVAENTASMFEADPTRLTVETRARLHAVYAILEEALEKLRVRQRA